MLINQYNSDFNMTHIGFVYSYTTLIYVSPYGNQFVCLLRVTYRPSIQLV